MTTLRYSEALEMIAISRASKTGRGDKPKATVAEDGQSLTWGTSRDSNKDVVRRS